MPQTLYLANGQKFEGIAFGANTETSGEVVFTTGMTGYLEILTDPSYYGQIIVFTFPLIGNYGVFDEDQFLADIDKTFESKKIWAKGVILTEHSEEYSHCQAVKSFAHWLKEHNIPALTGIDTRELTQILREEGTILGTISDKKPTEFTDSLNGRFVPEVSPQKFEILEPTVQVDNPKTIAFIDCGAKNAIFRNFLERGVRVLRFPFDQNPFEQEIGFDGLFISNGPGDPETVTETITIAKQALEKGIPLFGICLGNQILALASGGKTEKMKYGHRGVNQPCQDIHTGKCIITSQNHGFVVDEASLADDFEVWFRNLNDNSIEGIRHKSKPVFSVQFHPEACAGPEDAEYLFDTFVEAIKK